MVPSTLLGLLAVGLTLAAIPIYQWVSLVPRLGIRTLYHVREIRVALATLGVTLALIAARRSRSGRRYLVVVLALTPLSGALHASRLLVPLDDPEHRTVEDRG
jgi:hypothetical protein